MIAQDQTAGSQPRKPHWLRVMAIGRNPKVTLVRALVLAVLCVIGYRATLLRIRVEGISMLPAYQDGSAHFVLRLAYLFHEPRRGDVVCIRFSHAATNTPAAIEETVHWWEIPHVMLLKRVIGLPGETVAFADGRVLINGQALAEPYETTDCSWNLPPVTLGPNEYFVVGDNRTMPPEDHVFGKVERYRIVGKILR